MTGSVASPAASRFGATIRRLVGNILYLGAGEGAARAIALIVSLIVARVLGPTQFGGIALAQSIVLYFAALGDGGLTVWTQQQIVLHRDRLSRLVSETVSAQLLLGVAALTVMCAVGFFVPLPHGTAVLIIAASPFGLTQALTTMYALQAVESMRSAASVRVWTQIATAAITIAVLPLDQPVLVVISLWVGQFLGAAYSITLLWRRLGFRPTRPDLSGIRLAIKSGSSLLGAITLFQYIGLASTVLLGVLGSGRDVGYFSAATRPILLAPSILGVLGNSLYPEMIRRHQVHPSALGDFFQRALRPTLWASFVGALLILALAQPIIDVLYGQRYSPSIGMLRVLGFLFPAFALLYLSMFALTAAQMNRHVVLAASAGAFAVTVAAPILITTAGVDGAAWALLAGHVAVGLSMSFSCRSFMGLQGWVAILREIGAGLAAIGVVIGVQLLAGWSSPWALLGLVLITVTVVEVVRGFPTVGHRASRPTGLARHRRTRNTS